MKRFEVSPILKKYYDRKPYPRFYWMNKFHQGFDQGLYITWFNKMVVLIRPIDKRK